MTNSTGLIRPQELRPGQVVTTWPDGDLAPDRMGEDGRWTVTRVYHYGEVTRVDWRDDDETGTWVLPSWTHLSVEMSDRELQAAAARVIADLAEQADLPPIFEWRISGEDGVSGQIGHCPSREQALQEWADYLGTTVTATPCSDYTYMSVSATVNGIRVAIWTHGPAPRA